MEHFPKKVPGDRFAQSPCQSCHSVCFTQSHFSNSRRAAETDWSDSHAHEATGLSKQGLSFSLKLSFSFFHTHSYFTLCVKPSATCQRTRVDYDYYTKTCYSQPPSYLYSVFFCICRLLETSSTRPLGRGESSGASWADQRNLG